MVAALFVTATIGASIFSRDTNFFPLRVAAYFSTGVAALVLVFLLVLTVLSARRTGVAFQFTPRGIIHTRVGWPLISWEAVSSLQTDRIGISVFGMFFCTTQMLTIRPKIALPSPIKTAADGSTSFAIDGLDPNHHVILQWLERRHPALLNGNSKKELQTNTDNQKRLKT